MDIKGHDLQILRPNAERSYGYFFSGKEFGDPCVIVSAAPAVPLNIGSATPAGNAGGSYDVRDAEGEKAITHLDWHLGAGQKSLDADESSAYKFLESENIDISTQGRILLRRAPAYTPMMGASGPVFSFDSYLFICRTNGDIMYSSDAGATWTAATWTGTAPTAPVGDFTTDGEFVYCCSEGATGSGVWKGTLSLGAWNFAKIGASSTEKVSHVCYHGGFFYAALDYAAGAIDSKVGILDSSSSYAVSTSLVTPATLKYYQTAALVAAGNRVYWVVSQGGMSFVYQLYYDPTDSILSCEQYGEFPSGFVATCAVGYLSDVYIGGYWTSGESECGMGSVYLLSSGMSAPLFNLGERPENTDIKEDNRIYAITAGAKDVYFITNRACYRWDIDDGGYSHMFDLTNSGYGEQEVSWDYQWDGTDQTGTSGEYWPADWDGLLEGNADLSFATAGYATVTGDGNFWLQMDPAGFDSADGMTLQVAAISPDMDITIYDGTNKAKVHVSTNNITVPRYAEVYNYETTEWLEWMEGGDTLPGWYTVVGYTWIPTGFYEWTDSTLSPSESFNGVTSASLPTGVTSGQSITFRVTLKGGRVTVGVVGGESVSHSMLESTTENEIEISSGEGTAINYIVMAVDEAVALGDEIETLNFNSIAYHNGRVFAPYAIPSYDDSLEISSVSTDNPAVVTTATNHGLTTDEYVYIDGTGLAIDGNSYQVTSTGAATFTIPVSGGAGAAEGWVSAYDNTNSEALIKEGFSYHGDSYSGSGTLTQSETTFHTGSMKKDFRAIEVLHEELSGGSIGMTVWVDGLIYTPSGAPSNGRTVFSLNVQGYSIKTRIHLSSDQNGTTSPIVKGINVLWDFVKVKKRQYSLDCRQQSGSGLWREDAYDAIQYLFDAANEKCTFQDAFGDEYEGVVQSVEFKKASYSSLEKPSGIVQLVVREVS